MKKDQIIKMIDFIRTGRIKEDKLDDTPIDTDAIEDYIITAYDLCHLLLDMTGIPKDGYGADEKLSRLSQEEIYDLVHISNKVTYEECYGFCRDSYIDMILDVEYSSDQLAQELLDFLYI